jgi:hypothetical protein
LTSWPPFGVLSWPNSSHSAQQLLAYLYTPVYINRKKRRPISNSVMKSERYRKGEDSQNRLSRTEQPEHDTQNETARMGQTEWDSQDRASSASLPALLGQESEQDSRERTARTGQPEQDSLERTVGSGHPEKESQTRKAPDWESRTGQAEDGMQNRTARTGLPGQDHQDRTTRTGLQNSTPMHDGWERTAKAGQPEQFLLQYSSNFSSF